MKTWNNLSVNKHFWAFYYYLKRADPSRGVILWPIDHPNTEWVLNNSFVLTSKSIDYGCRTWYHRN